MSHPASQPRQNYSKPSAARPSAPPPRKQSAPKDEHHK
jgi:hypothetical protein